MTNNDLTNNDLTNNDLTTDELIAATSGPIGSMGSSFYFVPETLAVGKARGLDGFRWYLLGRGGVLGDVDASVITAAFGYFHPALVNKLWTTAKAVVPPREAGAAYHECAADFGRRKFSDVAGLAEYCAAAEKVIAAADRDGLALFAGIAAEPLADDLPGRAMQLTAVLREYRGSVHLAAVIASGLRAREAHFIKRPNDVKTFGYDESEALVVTPEMEAALASAEEATNRGVRRAYAVLSPEEAKAFATGVQNLQSALDS